MLPSFFRRHRRSDGGRGTEQDEVDDDDDIESQMDAVRREQRTGTHSDRALLLMAQNHMLAFVITLYMIYILCRCLGWKPGAKSTTYTLDWSREQKPVTTRL